MAMLFYTTEVPAEKTIGEIIALLARKGAATVSQNYEGGAVVGISFQYKVGGVPVTFSLPANEAGVVAYMLTEAVNKLPDWNRSPSNLKKGQLENIKAQGRRTAWRVLKAWIEAQIALVESQQADLGQVFMPYALLGNGQTMYQGFVENNQRLLGSGGNL